EMKRLRDAEKQSNVLEKVHDHYIEIALALLSQSKTSDAGKREKARIRYLLREIVELRRNKIVEAMKTEIEAHQEALNVTGMSAAERTCFRTRSLYIVDHFVSLLAGKKVAHLEGDPESADTMQEEDSLRADSGHS
ncbi:unnamed protein product, partial [Prorocentrum cordatum]